MRKKIASKGRITIDIDDTKHSLSISSDTKITWKEMLETCVIAMKQHAPSGTREVDMVDHLISVHGVTTEFVSRLVNQLEAQRAQSSGEAPKPSELPSE